MQVHLFEGGNRIDSLYMIVVGNQYSHYCKLFRQMLHVDEVYDYLVEHGIDPHELGAHSLRKGSASYVSGGSADGILLINR